MFQKLKMANRSNQAGSFCLALAALLADVGDISSQPQNRL